MEVQQAFLNRCCFL